MSTPRLVFCAGMMRSGSTLQFNLVKEILQANGQNVTTAFQTPAEFVQDWEEGRYMDAQNVFIKTHQTDFTDVFQAGLNPLITYTYRDLRDVYLSGKEKFGWDGDNDLCSMLDKAIDNYNRIRTLSDEVCLVQSYEQLYKDRREAVQDLVEFLSIRLPPSRVDEISTLYSLDKIKEKLESNKNQRIYLLYRKVEKCTPGIVRQVLKKSGWLRDLKIKIRSNKVDNSTMFHADHISKRKGVPGQWRNYLGDAEITLIETRYKDYLVENDYL